ncbi:MAG: hypothetical protein JNK04_25660, partial [Myxococcales bacterium]|nr:hypothetical protein [Myxococcales bacterium]
GGSTGDGAAAAGGNGSGAGGGEGPVGGSAALLPPECPVGTVEVGVELDCDGGPQPSSVLGQALASSTRGELYDAGSEIGDAVCMPVRSCVSDGAPTLIFSDEPEYVDNDGVLYAEMAAPGRYRLYLYHVNDDSSPRRFTAVALNEQNMATTLTVEKAAMTAPSTAFLNVGRAVATAYYTATGKPPLSIAPGQRVVIDSDLDALVADPGELIHAIIEVQIAGMLKISIVSVGANDDAAAVTAGLNLLPDTGLHVRGTFPLADRLLLARHVSGLGRLRLGGDTGFDPDLSGTSFVDGTAVTLPGNFGVSYDVRLVEPAVELALLLNPRAGAWAGAMFGSAGVDANAGLHALPNSGLVADDSEEAISLGRYTSGITIGTKLLTAGGSSLPAHVVAMPLP